MTDKNEISNEVILRLQKNDQNAFKEIFDLFCDRLVYFSYNIVHEQEVAENIVQDCFLFLWENRSEIDISKNLKTYLYTIVKNRSLKYLRHLDVRNRKEPDIKLIYSKNVEIDKDIEANELNKHYNKAIQKLPEKCREIFLLSRNDELKYKEIAELLNISVKTVETQMSRALKSLRDYLSYLLTILLFFL